MPLLSEKEWKVAQVFTKRLYSESEEGLHIKEIAKRAFPDEASTYNKTAKSKGGGTRAYRWVQNCTRKLVRDGVLERSGRGEYMLTDLCIKALADPDIGGLLKQWREAQGFSQDEAAEELGVKRSYFAHVENGERLITIADLFSVTHAIGVRVADVLEVELPGEAEARKSDLPHHGHAEEEAA